MLPIWDGSTCLWLDDMLKPLTNPNIRTICKACPKNVTLWDRSICDMLIPTINPNIETIYIYMTRPTSCHTLRWMGMLSPPVTAPSVKTAATISTSFGSDSQDFTHHPFWYDLNKYWSWLENLQRVPIRHPKRSKAFLLCGSDAFKQLCQ